ncbi:MAG TPA: YebC/PmpR family DNA-binding transcriptional regulator [Candidatus Paceibacterota bacterium]|nr:YebC/PmpR family DNA-binding transcriptional regulator [Candidatus Paceibacterota bacterium]
MSGHNKWSQIKHKKAKTDGQKAKVFSKYSKLITVEVKKANGDKNAAGVRAMIERARAENVLNDVIDRAIKKATEVGGKEMESIIYETYGPGGCAIIIEALTDNKNKAAQEVKFILSGNGLTLASIGSATWAFEKKGSEWIPKTTIEVTDEDADLLGKLVEELEANDEVQDVFTNAE